MGGAHIKINSSRWDRIVTRAIGASTDRAVTRQKGKLRDEVYRAGRVQSGRMANEWEHTEIPALTPRGKRYAIWSPFEYTKYQNDGTRGSKPIPPRKALRIPVGGGAIFRTKSGPITAARFMQRASGSMTVSDWL
ncbi:hypothetical protein HOT31_gp067 [Microbacterium phage Hendrix]|uniref:Uncharacterized protein n=1 Tax=Microbacterium phage Hendrix TaxID=2182341 RepID=A0A2U8UU97_9CAUD|nr:hypothetical protein HOT31_gp067 [Microbacterium phage Hendrix]AWN07738.1 hypothetical protein PBI_HENDRIX_67 [Microbacterium phage Hendrix]